MQIRRARPASGLAALCTLLLGIAGPAEADGLDDFLDQKRLTGDWGGIRTDLEDFGISPYARYMSEVAGNPSGGRNQGHTYTDQIDFGLDFDLGKLVGLDGGKIRVAASDRNGDSLSADDIGNIFAVQQDFGGNQKFRLAEVSYEQSLLDDRLNFRVGRLFAANDFAVSPLYCNLMSKAFCARPNSLTLNAPISSYPVATWGGRVRAMPTSDTYLQIGAYEDNPSLAFKDGTDFSTEKATGAFIVAEFAYLYDLEGTPGHYKIGVWHDTSDAADFYEDVNGNALAKTGLPARTHDGQTGGYILLDQMLYKEAPDSDNGLTAFLGFTFADDDTALLPFFAMGGLVYTGPFEGRDRDKLSFGLALGHVSDEKAHTQRLQGLDEQTNEAVLELNYQFQLTPWLNLMPDLQYIIRPGATGDIPDATVLGLRTTVTF